MFNKEPLIRAIKISGSQTALAQAIRDIIPASKVRQGHVSNWLNRDKQLPPQYATVIEKITSQKVLRTEWTPLYGIE